MPSSPPQIRRFDIRHDLQPVADLVELCFNDSLDENGKRYIQQMRQAAKDSTYLRWANRMREHSALPMSGYVWQEGDRIVGNLSLIPYYSRHETIFLIANVAVHPDYRRQGIARLMTETAIQKSIERGANAIWLHVRKENIAAINLYKSLYFIERTCRTTWNYNRNEKNGTILDPEIEYTIELAKKIAIHNRSSADWILQKEWLEKHYPVNIRWNLGLKSSQLAPGLAAWLEKFWNEIHIIHLSAYKGSQLLGVLSTQFNWGDVQDVWLCLDHDYENPAAYALLKELLNAFPRIKSLSFEYPENSANTGLRIAGLIPQHTLIWMSLDIPSYSKRSIHL